MPYAHYQSRFLSIFCLCPFKYFCFLYNSFRFSPSVFMRSKRSRTPSQHSSSIFLYSPVRLWIVLLFVLICSDRQLTYPVYQILHFLIRFINVCFHHNLSARPHHHCLLFINSFIPLSKNSYPAISSSFKIISQNLVPLVRDFHK